MNFKVLAFSHHLIFITFYSRQLRRLYMLAASMLHIAFYHLFVLIKLTFNFKTFRTLFS